MVSMSIITDRAFPSSVGRERVAGDPELCEGVVAGSFSLYVLEVEVTGCVLASPTFTPLLDINDTPSPSRP